MTAVVLVPLGLLVALLLAMWLRNRFEMPAVRGGSRLMRRRAARHTALLERTLLVHADPATVTAIVRPVMDGRTLFVPAEPAADEDAAWTSTSSVTRDLPRMVVRASPVAGWTEFGVVAYAWWFRFPQGGLFVTRMTTPAHAALEAAGLPVQQRRREFVAPLLGPTSDGVHTAVPFGPAGPAHGSSGPD